MKAVISTETDDIPSLLSKVKAAPGLLGRDLVKEVSCRKAYIYRSDPAEEKESWLEYLPVYSQPQKGRETGRKELQSPKKYVVVAMFI